MSRDTLIHELRAIVGESPGDCLNPLDALPSLTITLRCFGAGAGAKNVVNECIELTPHLDLGYAHLQ